MAATLHNELVLVTGGSGFVGIHCVDQLLHNGYLVRTTIRSLKKKDAVIQMLKDAATPNLDRLSFAEVDLIKDNGWKEAVTGCTYVLHVASPFPMGEPKNENDLIIPAREGTIRVLKAARDAGVKRVVVTSSFVAIGYGRTEEERIFTEQDWTPLDGPEVGAYSKSKTIAERAAWDFIKTEGGDMELTVVNPVGIFGPAYGKDLGTSMQIVQRFLKGGDPGVPDLSFGAVDVRDVADLHIRAMLAPEANGQRYLCASGTIISLLDIAKILKKEFPAEAKKTPTRQIPNMLVKFIGLFDKGIAMTVPLLSKRHGQNVEKARGLGWTPRSNEEAIIASASSLIKLGLI